VAPTAAVVRVVEVGTAVQWGIVGGTGDFRTARGDVTAIVTPPGIFDIAGGSQAHWGIGVEGLGGSMWQTWEADAQRLRLREARPG
jgi:hypothetical protein